ncbi:MAG: complement resistance protein TraT [Candidatus Paceibacterota bacterium]
MQNRFHFTSAVVQAAQTIIKRRKVAMNKVLCPVFCLLLGFGCTGPSPDRHVNYSERDINGNVFKRIHVTPGAVRTVCIQPDPIQPEMAFIAMPLQKQLTAKGYKVVATPDEAVHTMRLHINVLDTEYKPAPNKNGLMAPNVGWAAGTAVGGAVSGNALHAGLTPGGQVGGVAGLVAGSILSASSKDPNFFAEVDVKISDPISGEQHTVRGVRWHLIKDYNNPEVRQVVNQMAANNIANKIAALMP